MTKIDLIDCINKPFHRDKMIGQDLKPHHIVGVDFLLRTYKRNLKGAILNEEEDMNMQLQVSTFLKKIYPNLNCLILIVCPDYSIPCWHYHLINHANLKVKILTSENCPEDFDVEENPLALLLSFKDLKLLDNLIDYQYFAVVVDKFDEIAQKLIFKKLCGDFNVGLTHTSFYMFPNAKLQWTMLNWTNPGCVGKLIDFYEVENENFMNFRDNYRRFWFRLTWNFCDGFVKPSEDEKMIYDEKLSTWVKNNNLKIVTLVVRKPLRKNRKRKAETEGICDEENELEELLGIKEEQVEVLKTNEMSRAKGVAKRNVTKLPIMDENPILTSIIKNLEDSPEPVETQNYHPSMSGVFSSTTDDNRVLSIQKNEDFVDYEGESSSHNEFFSDEPSTSKRDYYNSSESFIESLVFTSKQKGIVKSKDGRNIGKKNLVEKRSFSNDDIKSILEETDSLLQDY